MRYLWLAGLVAVAGLVLAAGLRAAEERAPRGEGRTGEARAGRTRAPAVTLTAEQEEALAPAVTELKAAVAKFKAAATKTLGENDGRTYMTRTIFGLMRAERPTAPKPAEGAKEGDTEK
ncbi:MAG: hypothetical protein WBD75_10295 [Phycisphaerae bacterium]